MSYQFTPNSTPNAADIAHTAYVFSPEQFVQAVESPYEFAPSDLPSPGQPARSETDIDEALARMANEKDKRREQFWEELREKLMTDLSALANKQIPHGTLALNNDNYRLEKLDKHHRMGDLLRACLDEYDKRKPPQGFFDWLDGMPEYERMIILRGRGAGKVQRPDGTVGFRDDILLPSVVQAFVRGVAYLDKRARRTYRIGFRSGRMYQNDIPFDTGIHRTVFSGAGWAIYVLSAKRLLYANSHIFGQFHHSSFTKGDAVICAGEMQVSQGQLKMLTAKTGHYRTPRTNFIAGIQYLREKGVDPHSYKVTVYNPMIMTSDGKSTPVIITAGEFLATATKYHVFA